MRVTPAPRRWRAGQSDRVGVHREPRAAPAGL